MASTILCKPKTFRPIKIAKQRLQQLTLENALTNNNITTYQLLYDLALDQLQVVVVAIKRQTRISNFCQTTIFTG